MRLTYMLRKEALQFRRNPVLLRMALVLPLVQTLLLSFAANLDVTRVPVVVWDEDASRESRDMVARIDASPYFELLGYRLSGDALQACLDRGEAMLALHFPPHFARDLHHGRATAQLLVDGTDSSTASVAAGYLQQIAAAYAREERLGDLARRGLRLRVPSIQARSRVLYNPDLRSLWFMAPAVLAMVLTVLMQNLTALSIARERELGTLEQLVMTPIRSSELLLGKLLPFGLVGLLDAAVVTGVVVGFLRVPLRGSLPTLFAATILFLFAVLGLGLLVSTVSANQQQAQLTNFFLIFPSILLSGFIFPVDNLPSWMAPLSKVVPMTYYLEVVRGVFLRGTGVARLGWELGSLAVLAAVFFTAGAVRFRKRLD